MGAPEILLDGTWLYAGRVDTRVTVHSAPAPFPSAEDVSEPHADSGPFFYVTWFEPGNPNVQASSVGSFASLGEARTYAEVTATSPIRWRHKSD